MCYGDSRSFDAASKDHTAVATACRKFVKSPLILCAIIAYTIYTVICVAQNIDSLKYLDECFELFEHSSLLAVASITSLLMFIPPIIITCGLWSMFNSKGMRGSNAIRAGINTYLGMIICFVFCVLLAVYSALDSSGLFDEFSEIFSELLGKLLLPMAYLVFSLVAIASLRNFAESVETTACSRTACFDGVYRSGILILIFLALTVIFSLKLEEKFADILSILPETSEGDLYELATISRLLAFLLFAIATFVYNNAMHRAKGADENVIKNAPAYILTAIADDVNSWKCSCGRVNPNHYSTCACGASKYNSDINAPAKGSGQVEERNQTAQSYVFCTQCGTKCVAQAKFCSNCGNKLVQQITMKSREAR